MKTEQQQEILRLINGWLNTCKKGDELNSKAVKAIARIGRAKEEQITNIIKIFIGL